MARSSCGSPTTPRLNVEGTIYRAGDVFEIERDDTAMQWLGAGFVSEVKARRKSSGRKTSGGRLTRRGKR